ncbi:VOC family protein [Natronococcus occultus]|uniref:Putative ring-cleavage extradiol dioxygenase n=1 Tax=Natronococcus occultus SP4 TaxID=694430 RepID=L0JVK4_9EURY|nr:VOC family protein [Natronococcus occultus]AGB37067.1 putative ring-cleavage extradiol dioxygenase [Natronococcus occultus SP4]
MATQPTLPDTARIGRTALVVADLDDTTEFYRDVVGLEVLTRDETTTELGDGETTLLVLVSDEDAAPRGRNCAGLFHNAFKVPSRTALGAALERVRDRWQLDGASDHHVSEALYLTDPEDNGVEIYTDRPRAEWPRRNDGTVRIGTGPLDLGAIEARSDGAASVPAGTVVGHVHLETTNLETARRFYVDTLGLVVQTAVPEALFLAAGDYHHHLGVNVWNGRSRPAEGRGVAWFEFVLPDETALETARRGLGERGIAVETKEKGFEVEGPDGISIRFRTE